MFTCVGVSSPSRYSLITGRYPSEDGANYMRVNHFVKSYEAVPPAGVKCYTEYLRRAGYYCTNNEKTDYQFTPLKAAWDEQGRSAHWRNAAKDQPFFAVFNLGVTHESLIWKNADKPLVVDPNDVVLPPYYPDTEVVRRDMAVLYSNIATMDAQFQALLTELEKSDRADNTIVIFYADNGGPMPRGKREILDSGSRVPFMIRLLDGERAGEVTDQLNMFIDIPATVMSLAGVEQPKNIFGQPMYGDDKAKKLRRYVFGATDRFDEQAEKRGSIRDSRYLYLYNYMPEQSVYRPVAYRLNMPMMRQMVEMFEAGELNEDQRQWFEAPNESEFLYDCAADPHQLRNLAADPAYAKTLERMRKAYRKEWIERYNKRWVSWSEEQYIAEREPEGKKQVVEPIDIEVESGRVSVTNDLDIYSVSYRVLSKGNAKSQFKLYVEPFEVEKGSEVEFVMERIGFVAATKKITTN